MIDHYEASLSMINHYQPWLAIIHPIDQWPFQEPKLEVPTIYKAYYVSGNTTQNMTKQMVLTYFHIKGSWNSHQYVVDTWLV